MTKSLINLLLVLILSLVASCSSEQRTKGEITFSARFLSGQSLDCLRAGISTIEAVVRNNSGDTVANGGPWDCQLHSGSIDNVLANSGYTVLLYAKNGQGDVIYLGTKAEVTVLAGQVNNIGELNLLQPPPNQPPGAPSITTPASDSIFITVDSISFSASAIDPEDGRLSGESLVWLSDIDGVIGSGESISSSLSVGTHNISITATDSKSLSAAGSLELVVGPSVQPPFLSGPQRTTNTAPMWSWQSAGGNSNYRYKIDNPDLSTGASQTTATNFSPAQQLSENDHTMYIQAQDNTGAWSRPASFTITIDNTAPLIDVKIPSEDDQDVPLNAVISANFSEAVDVSTVTRTTFNVVNGNGSSVNGSFIFNNNDRLIAFVPDNDLATDTYTVSVTSAVTDLAGNPLTQNEVWRFTTGTVVANCRTNISAGVVVDQVWTMAGSPYCVSGDIQVSLLTVEAGVEVLVEGPYAINVLSTITVNGTETNPVRFSALNPLEPTNQRWKGLKFDNALTGSVLSHCVVEYSDDSGIAIVDSLPLISQCNISNNTSVSHGGGIHAELSEGQVLEVHNSIISNNTGNPDRALGNYLGGGVYVIGDAIIANSTINGNSVYGQCNSASCNAYGEGGGIYIAGDLTLLNSDVRENLVWARSGGPNPLNGNAYALGGGIFVANVSPTTLITNSSVSCNTSNAICSGSYCNVAYSGFAWAAGIYIAEGTTTINNSTLFQNNTEASNQSANPAILIQDSAALRVVLGDTRVNSSIIYENNPGTNQIFGDVVASYSDIQGSFEGTGVIESNPVFAGLGCAVADQNLLAGSPAIDAGDSDGAQNDQCIPPSKDAIRNDMGVFGGPQACGWVEANITVLPFSVDFAAVANGNTSSESITIVNTGVADLQISGFEIIGSNTFTLANDHCTAETLSPAQSCVMELTFSPKTTGSNRAQLTIRSNDRDSAGIAYEITGQGI